MACVVDPVIVDVIDEVVVRVDSMAINDVADTVDPGEGNVFYEVAIDDVTVGELAGVVDLVATDVINEVESGECQLMLSMKWNVLKWKLMLLIKWQKRRRKKKMKMKMLKWMR